MSMTKDSPFPTHQGHPTGPSTEPGLATCFIGDTWFGMDVAAVREIRRVDRITWVPLAPAHIKGIINLRGQIVTVIDLGSRTGVSSAYGSRIGHIIVVDAMDEAVGLGVEGIGDVIHLSWDGVDPPPANLTPTHRRLLKGVLKTEERLVEILDLCAVLEIEGGE